MVVHEDISVDAATVPARALDEVPMEEHPVAVREEDRPAIIPRMTACRG
jgi:hypothetical protein